MRRSLRTMIDSGMLAAAAPAFAKKPNSGEGDDGASEAKPVGQSGGSPQQPPMGPQELHVHLHAPMDPSQMDTDSDEDPSDDEDQDPSDQDQDPSDEDQGPTVGNSKNASPMANHIAKNIIDPVGQTKPMFEKLAKTKMAYNLAQEEARRALIGPETTIQHIKQMHQLDGPTAGDPMGMVNNPDAAMGADQQTGMPPSNMNQQPGNGMQQQNPQNSRMAPGASPNLVNNPRLNPRVPGAGSATQGAQTQVRPPKAGVPKPGQSNGGTKAGNPSSKGGGKSIKLEVKSAADTRCQNRNRRKMEASAAIANLRF